MKRIIFFTLLALNLSEVCAQNTIDSKFFLELEPLMFFNAGFSIVGHYAINDRMQIGTNIFSQELSQGFNDLAFDFDDNLVDLQATQDLGVNVSFRYFLKKPHEGWVVSLPIGYETWTIEDLDTDVSENDYTFWYLSPRVGYLWYPFSPKRFYLLGELLSIIPFGKSSPVNLGSTTVEINSFIVFPGLGLGFSF